MSISVQSGRKRPRRAAPRPPTAVGRRSRASQGALLLCLMLMILRLAPPLQRTNRPRTRCTMSRCASAPAAARWSLGRASVRRRRSSRRAIGRRHGGRRPIRKFLIFSGVVYGAPSDTPYYPSSVIRSPTPRAACANARQLGRRRMTDDGCPSVIAHPMRNAKPSR